MVAAGTQGEKAQEKAIVAWLGTQQGEMLALLEDLVHHRQLVEAGRLERIRVIQGHALAGRQILDDDAVPTAHRSERREDGLAQPLLVHNARIGRPWGNRALGTLLSRVVRRVRRGGAIGEGVSLFKQVPRAW